MGADFCVGQSTGQWISRFNHAGTLVGSLSGYSWPSTFEAINLAVIPGVTSNANDAVIAWNSDSSQPSHSAATWVQRFTVGDPEAGPSAFNNYIVAIPRDTATNEFFGDLFCAGHCWLPDGRLFVAGGTTQYNVGGYTNFLGSRFVGFWNPAAQTSPHWGWDFSLINPTGSQTFRPLAVRRWYPTVTLISGRYVMVSGGSSDTSISPNTDIASKTYEIFDLQTSDWIRDAGGLNYLFDCPLGAPGVPSPAFGQFPRLHLLSNNRVFLSGMWQESAFVVNAANPILISPPPGYLHYSWTDGFLSVNPLGGSIGSLSWASHVLVPNVGRTAGGRDEIMAIGGSGAASTVSDISQRINAGSQDPLNPPQWGGVQSMAFARMLGNALLSPNGDIVMMGGSRDHYFDILAQSGNPTPVLDTEVWDKVDGWQLDAQQASPRMYHSTSGLLRSGRMVSAGSDIRTYDWEIYEPRNIAGGQVRPQLAGAWASSGVATLAWSTEYQVDHNPLPVGVAISRVVLMRPCSTTHHSDMDQRYIELEIKYDGDGTGGNFVRAVTPPAPTSGSTPNSVVALPGYYFMFLVTTEGAPSVAKRVQLP